ncbi:hypothetical protein SEA_SEABASTIAN_41 [Mycobacterium phage Seabastian]|nr:hypothetical protein SEA_SEABASTIAN_41 [Mycobacterium phage Seabastian]QOP67235.1 hypothetical protein SEA_OFULTRON_41 [Mycobacterium phage OfUltron]
MWWLWFPTMAQGGLMDLDVAFVGSGGDGHAKVSEPWEGTCRNCGDPITLRQAGALGEAEPVWFHDASGDRRCTSLAEPF